MAGHTGATHQMQQMYNMADQPHTAGPGSVPSSVPGPPLAMPVHSAAGAGFHSPPHSQQLQAPVSQQG